MKGDPVNAKFTLNFKCRVIQEMQSLQYTLDAGWPRKWKVYIIFWNAGLSKKWKVYIKRSSGNGKFNVISYNSTSIHM